MEDRSSGPGNKNVARPTPGPGMAQARADRGDRCGAAAADEHGGDLSFPKGTKGYTPTRNQRSSWKRSALPPERATCVRPETHTHSQGRVTSNVLGSLGR